MGGLTTVTESVTDVARLRERVAEYWPRWAARFSVSQAAGILRRFRRFGLADLLEALERHYEEQPDGRAPAWSEVWDQADRLAGRQRAAAGSDDAVVCRRWWGSWRSERQARAEPERFAWAFEIMACDDRTRVGADRTVMPADYAAWHTAVFACGDWAFYLAGRPWWPADGGPLVFADRGPRVELRPGERGAPPPNAVRIAALNVCHRLVRNLRTFGPATTAWKNAALAALETEARAAGVRIDGVDDLVSASPF